MSKEKKQKPEEQEPNVEETVEATAAEPEVQPPEPEEEPLRGQLLRLQADFDNFRKRTQRERSELFLFANESLFLEMLPVIDHFEMGLKSAEGHKADASVTEGFQMVYNQLMDVLKKFNVTPIDAIGEPFNPHRHEAITHLPSDKPAETVIEQVRRGYMLGEKLLRAAQVVVSSGTPAAETTE
jgi:molecular chaperone GrpE